MASLDSALTRQVLSEGVIRQVQEDTAIGLRLRYIGTGTVTTVAVTQATSVVLTTSTDTDTYLFSAYATLGALADAISSDSRFEVKVVDALRSENPDDFFTTDSDVTVGADNNGVACYDLLIDTSASLTQTICLSPTSPDFNKPKGHRVHLQEVFYNVTHTAAAGTFRIYKRKGATETEVYRALGVNATDTTITWASGRAKLTADPDEEILVQVSGTVTTVTDGNIIRVVGIYE
jgi:hypothetical protein